MLLAVCDANKKFIYVDVGAYGMQSDGGVFAAFSFGRRLNANELNLPEPDLLPDTNTSFPYFIIGDEAFPLGSNLLRPYSGRNLPTLQKYYNSRLSSVRKVVEDTFGILVQRWRIFLRVLHADPKNVDSFIKHKDYNSSA